MSCALDRDTEVSVYCSLLLPSVMQNCFEFVGLVLPAKMVLLKLSSVIVCTFIVFSLQNTVSQRGQTTAKVAVTLMLT